MAASSKTCMTLSPSEAAGLGGGETRRRSVHFDACPTTLVVQAACSNPSQDEEEEEPQGGSKAACGGLSIAKHQQNRRKSAPPGVIPGSGAVKPSQNYDRELLTPCSETLSTLDPELRRSLTKLSITNIEEDAEDLDVIRPKLLGRDELEIRRLKQMKLKEEEEEDHEMDKAADEAEEGASNAKVQFL